MSTSTKTCACLALAAGCLLLSVMETQAGLLDRLTRRRPKAVATRRAQSPDAGYSASTAAYSQGQPAAGAAWQPAGGMIAGDCNYCQSSECSHFDSIRCAYDSWCSDCKKRRIEHCRKKCGQTYYEPCPPFCQPCWGYYPTCWRRMPECYVCPKVEAISTYEQPAQPPARVDPIQPIQPTLPPADSIEQPPPVPAAARSRSLPQIPSLQAARHERIAPAARAATHAPAPKSVAAPGWTSYADALELPDEAAEESGDMAGEDASIEADGEILETDEKSVDGAEYETEAEVEESAQE